MIARQISPRSPPFEMITGPRAAAPVQSAMETGPVPAPDSTALLARSESISV